MPLSVARRTEGDVGVVTALGEVDLGSAGTLREAISELVAVPVARLVVDLGESRSSTPPASVCSSGPGR